MKIQILFAFVVVFVSISHSDAFITSLKQKFFGIPGLPPNYIGTKIYYQFDTKVPEFTRFTRYTLIQSCKWIVEIENELLNLSNIDLTKIPADARDQVIKGINAFSKAAKEFIGLMSEIAQSLTNRVDQIPGLIISQFGKLTSVFTSMFNAIEGLKSLDISIDNILPKSVKAFLYIPKEMWNDFISIPINMAMFTMSYLFLR